MQFSLLSFAILATAGVRTLALGINCEGSSQCTKDGSAQELLGYINTIDDFVWYENGQHIACSKAGPICAFLQNSGGLGAVDIKPLAAAIVAHLEQ
ncbi:hypothetical protein B0H13DRAFT_1628890 [Mycena leptocephala]|nr:hypothetical protein B0H13DRAFT_1628890 [Mycena leptocephala]